MRSGRPAKRRYLPNSPFNVPAVPEETPEEYAVNDRVIHDRYGLGKVVRVDSSTEVVVDFSAEVRLIAIPNPKLSKL